MRKYLVDEDCEKIEGMVYILVGIESRGAYELEEGSRVEEAEEGRILWK